MSIDGTPSDTHMIAGEIKSNLRCVEGGAAPSPAIYKYIYANVVQQTHTLWFVEVLCAPKESVHTQYGQDIALFASALRMDGWRGCRGCVVVLGWAM